MDKYSPTNPTTSPTQENVNQQPPPTNQNEILKPTSVNLPVIVVIAIMVVVILVVLGVGGYLLMNKNTAQNSLKSQNKHGITSTPALPSVSEKAQDTNSDERILYEDNGFSFYYPGSLEMYQAYVGDAVQWKPKNTDRIKDKERLDALTLHESENPLLAITTNGKFTIWNKGYFDARSEVTITSAKEDTVPLGQKKTTLFTIECGTNCHYAIVRFTNNKKNYEFIYNLASGDISVLKDILAGLSFYDPNPNNWRTYTSKGGHYTVKYPADSNFLEKVGWSVDGVRGYDENLITVFPQKFGIRFERIGDMTLDEYLKKNECGTIEERKRFTLSGEQAEYQSTACGIEGSSDVFVKHKDMIYVISYTTPEDPILATFKFVD